VTAASMPIALAWISLSALLAAIVLSCTTRLNIGLVAIVFAWIIAVYLAPHWGGKLSVKDVVAGFPGDLFLTLTGVTFLFSLAQVNGTLERVAQRAVGWCKGNRGLVPVMFFALTAGISCLGAGNIGAAALMGPLAMAAAARAGISAFLMTIMVAHGALAGALSPVAPTGVVANKLLNAMAIPGAGLTSFVALFLANVAVAFPGYLLLGGWRLFRRGAPEPRASVHAEGQDQPPFARALERGHVVTLVVILALIAVIVAGNTIGFSVDVGMGAFAAGLLLVLLRVADEAAAVRAMPWGVLLLVCGVTVLTQLVSRTGGMDLFTTLLAQVSTRESAPGAMAFVTGMVSVYSSTVGVVLPTFLPTVPGLVAKLGGGDPTAISLSILVGGHLVDVSPLSTIGALCIAGTVADQDRKQVFNQVLLWGLSMAFVGAMICQIVFGWLW
jgi:di/tricarboxylate transporter